METYLTKLIVPLKSTLHVFLVVTLAYAPYGRAASEANFIVPQAVLQVGGGKLGVMGKDLQMPNQKNWNFYSAADAPEGAYMGWMFSGDANLSGQVTLPATLPAGRYYVFVKGICYDVPLKIKVSMGGGESAVVAADDRDGNRRWTEMGEVKVVAPTNVMTIQLQKVGALAGTEKLLFNGLYITNDRYETVTRDDRTMRLVYPTEMNDNPPVKGNLVSNSGFETGVDSNWGFQGYKNIPFYSIWDNTTGFESQASLRIPLDPSTMTNPDSSEALISRVYHLKPNKKYTFSVWGKVTTGKSAAIGLRLTNTFTPPAGFPTIPDASGVKYLTDQWQRVSVTTYAYDYPTSDYQMSISIQNIPDTELWLDAVQLEEGDLTDYRPSHIVETALVTDQVAHLFNEDERAELAAASLLFRNNSAVPQSRQTTVQIFDYSNRMVHARTVECTAPANSTQKQSFDLYTGRRGIFRAVSWIEGVEGSEREFVYGVVPRPAVAGLDEASVMGIHPNYTDYQFSVFNKLGIKWARVLSPSAFFRWTVVEPVEGQIKFYDAEMERAAAHGIATLGCIGTNDFWPEWADNGGVPNLDKWATFVGALVDHYKPWVRTWEIWNEAYAVFTPEFYARMLKRSVEVIEVKDPTAIIVGMGGSTPGYVESVIAEMDRQFLPGWNWRDHIKVLSTHNYPNGSDVTVTRPKFVDPYGVQVWNTETGTWDRGFYAGAQSNFTSWGQSLWPHMEAERYYQGMTGGPESLVTNFLGSIGSGMSKYFYYDSRLFASPNYFLGHPTLFEYDGTVRSKGIAYAIAGHFIDHSMSLGDLGLTNSWAYLFERAGRPTLALWTKDRSNKTLTVNLPSSAYKAYDIMGNEISMSGGAIEYGPLPIYVVGSSSLNAAHLKAAVESGVVADDVDMEAPNLTITEAPRGPLFENFFRIRWLAVDETSLPGLGIPQPEAISPSNIANPDALLYSYRLVGRSDAWSTWTPNTNQIYSGLPIGTYRFEVQARDEAGNVSAVASRTIQIGALSHPGDGWGGPATGQDTEAATASGSFLTFVNVLKPGNGKTMDIAFRLTKETSVQLHLFDRGGRTVRTFTSDGIVGDNYVFWDGRNTEGSIVAAGMYILSLKAGSLTETKKVVILK